MKAKHVAIVIGITLLAFLPLSASARAWKGVMPGFTSRSDVLKKLGVPSQEIAHGVNESGFLYQGKVAPEGTKQVQVIFDANGVVTNIHVFPKADLGREQIEKTYGKNFVERLNDSFKTYFHYKDDGIVVYFKEGNLIVASITFQKPSRSGAVGEEAVVKGEDAVKPPTPPQNPPAKPAGSVVTPSASPSPASSPLPKTTAH